MSVHVPYIIEKLRTAERTLATHPGPINERLSAAFHGFGTLDSSHFEGTGLQDRFEKVMADLTRTAAKGDEGRVKATLHRMRRDKASAIAESLCDLLYDAERLEPVREGRRHDSSTLPFQTNTES